jgi:enediyne polyketide synthase
MKPSISIVGMACRYPDATSPQELWENVLSRRRAFRRIPPERLRLEDYFSENPLITDATYVVRAALIEGYEFDRERFRVMGSTYRAVDLAHWLALDVASQALEDAGFIDGEGLPRMTTGVLVGNTLTGEFSRASLMRLRWPYVRRVVNARLADEGWESKRRAEFLGELESLYKRPFAEQGDETLAGGLSNTIAGRICNNFDFGGGGYTIDGACSSSLLSLANACTALMVGDIDAALVGGVDLSLDPFELVGFARLGAMAKGDMRVYDANPTGFLPGEGCGFVVLMRRDDALKQDLNIYTDVKGWGISSDGSGGLTRPEIPGQKLSLTRAYQRAGFGIDSVAYFEGHGTGTEIGDTVELTSLSETIRESTTDSLPAAIGSIKANIGHTKAAAGIAGLLKAVMAVNSQVIPPNCAVKTPHPILEERNPALRLSRDGEAWPTDKPLRAGINSMGFGGINVHVTIENPSEKRRKNISPDIKTLLTEPHDAELILLGGKDRADLADQVGRLLDIAPKLSQAELGDLAVHMAGVLNETNVRAAVVASSPEGLTKSLKSLARILEDEEGTLIDSEAGVFFGMATSQPEITYLFSGQASPANLDGGAMRRCFDTVDDLYQTAKLPTDSDGVHTSIAQPAIVTASMAGIRLLNEFGIKAKNAVGHSLGELTALYWAGVYSEAALLRIATARGQAMTEHCHEQGAMASIGAELTRVEKLLEGNGVVVAGINAPEQTVVSGKEGDVLSLISHAQAQGLTGVRLPVSHAFHSPLMAESANVFEQFLATEEFAPITGRVISTIEGRALEAKDNLKDILIRQFQVPVRFMDAIKAASEQSDLMVEIGPGEVLSGIAERQLAIPVISIDAAGPSLKGILHAVGAVYALGGKIKHEAITKGRFTRPFDLDHEPVFLVNPCELAPIGDESEMPVFSSGYDIGAPAEGVTAAELATECFDPESVDILLFLRQMIAEKTELSLSAIVENSRLLDDLHLNSLKVSRIVIEATKRLQLPPIAAPNRFASATVLQIAEALEQLRETGELSSPTGQIDGVDSWVRCFSVNPVERPLPPSQPIPEGGEWRLFAPEGHILADAVKRELEAWGGAGVIICMPPNANEDNIKLMLEGAQAALKITQPARLVFVQHDGGASSLAKTIHLEGYGLTTCVVDVPYKSESLSFVINEAKAAVGFTEANYDEAGIRRIPQIKTIPLKALPEDQYPLGDGDVLLVTGGGKGIGAECALSLAKESSAKVVIMGRSQPTEDNELDANLERFSAAGIDFEYVSADVTDDSAVKEVLHDVQEKTGAITAFLHSAGRNIPRLIRDLNRDSFLKTVNTKVRGAENILAAIDTDKLRLFISFGSIISRAGMRGEADYAVANEWLSGLIEKFQIDHPSCRCLALEWSIWSGVGMGERLGSVQEMALEGVTSITPDEGLEVLHKLLHRKLPSSSVVITGRFGNPPTLEMEDRQLPLYRFLEKCPVYYPGIELVASAWLSFDNDPYLRDHIFKGQVLFPAVMGMEAMAEAAMALAGSNTPPVFEDVQFEQPISIEKDGKREIRVAALMTESGTVEVVVRSEETSFAVNHFRAICRFDEDAEFGLERKVNLKIAAEPLSLDPKTGLYGDILFHQGRFQRLGQYKYLSSRGCVAEINARERIEWFGGYLPQELALGDPAVRDTTIHAIQACVPAVSILPVGVDRIILRTGSAMAPRLVYARERTHDNGLFIYDVEVVETDGRVVESFEGLRLQTIAGTEHSGKWSASLLGPYLEREVASLIPGAQVSIVIENGDVDNRRESSDRAIRHILGDDVEIQRRPDGKPETPGNGHISISHTDDLIFAVACPGGPVGCDAQAVVERRASVWRDLLGAAEYPLVEVANREVKEDKAVTATRVWSTLECLTKIGANADTPVVFEQADGDGWISFIAGHFRAVTYATEVTGFDHTMVFALMVDNDNTRV